jgi:hypothetical protein
MPAAFHEETNMQATYQGDVVAWANQQAAFLRARNFAALDWENLAEEIEDVGKSEKRELMSRMSILLAHLLKWQYQSGRSGTSWERTIKEQRASIKEALAETPSLVGSLSDPVWQRRAWGDAIAKAFKETGIAEDIFPENCPWTMEQVLAPDFFPA